MDILSFNLEMQILDQFEKKNVVVDKTETSDMQW